MIRQLVPLMLNLYLRLEDAAADKTVIANSLGGVYKELFLFKDKDIEIGEGRDVGSVVEAKEEAKKEEEGKKEEEDVVETVENKALVLVSAL